MSETKHISPLLDGITMGTPMSDHDGVRCCPAIKENSEKKYIVKIIAIPAEQQQMDALLLAGAYKDASGAMDYFQTVVDDVFKEAELLRKLSTLDGFLSYEGWQMEPITRRRLGYEVYLLGEYRRSLDKFVRKNPITQLEAINLSLDMCAALSVCRQAGALYVDLKPTNVFVSDKKEYRIGDLGFVSMDALSYTALPDKYRSPYTPPELLDPMENINMTTDTYALGMILYQIYNDGQLPPKDEEELPAPAHADYELAEIILKAIAREPENRWQDPKDMGQALVGYMQRNSVNDVPITPYIPLEQPEEPQKVKPEEAAEPGGEDTSEAQVPSEEESCEDETVPGEEDADSLQPHEMSDELSRMMAKADDLISHETPEGVVMPELPEPPDPFAFAKEEDADDFDIPMDPVMEEPKEDAPKKKVGSFVSQEGKAKTKRFLTGVASLALVAGIGLGTLWCYQNLYLQAIDGLTITGSRDRLSVGINTKVRESLLTVSCTDQYGNTQTQEVVNGQAVFGNLVPNTTYTVSLEVEGFHKLVGQISEVFTTDTTTRIVSFTAVAGPEDGSLILNFTADGQEPEEWNLTYSAPGEEPQVRTFSGHSLTLENLTVGKVYTFALDAGKDLSLGGKTSLDVMASRLILAQDITMTSTGSNDLTVHWRAPGDIVVDSWKVRCYTDGGYEQEFTVEDPEAFFSSGDFDDACTVEITAAGMTQSARANVTADPIRVTELKVEESDTALKLRWDFTGETPSGGWLLLYSVEGSEIPSVLKLDTPAAEIPSKVPQADYRFTILAADGTSVLNGVQSYVTAQAPEYEGNDLKAADVTASLLVTPENEGWRFEKLGSDMVTDEFEAGESISVGLAAGKTFYHPGEQVEILYVIRYAGGQVLGDLTASEKMPWKDIWAGADTSKGQLNVPISPDLPGEYILSVLVNGKVLAEVPFKIL